MAMASSSFPPRGTQRRGTPVICLVGPEGEECVVVRCFVEVLGRERSGALPFHSSRLLFSFFASSCFYHKNNITSKLTFI